MRGPGRWIGRVLFFGAGGHADGIGPMVRFIPGNGIYLPKIFLDIRVKI
jgi:hypothetical protein